MAATDVEVGSGAEGLGSGAGDHQYPGRVVVAELGHRRRKTAGLGRPDRISTLRAG